MRPRPSRLHRALAKVGITSPIAAITIDNDQTYSDDRIHSIVVNRGGDGPLAGIPGSSMQFSARGYVSSSIGEAVTFRMPDATATALASRTGATKSAIATRFHGRGAGFRINDTGNLRESTMISASSWTSILPGHSARYSFPSQQTVPHVLLTALSPADWPFIPEKIRSGELSEYGTTRNAITDASFSDLIRSYAEDLDILIRDKLDGRLELMGLIYRRDNALARLDVDLPLTRWQALSPAEWKQDHWQARRNYYVSVSTDMDGGTAGHNFGVLEETWRTQESIDLTHVVFPEHHEHWHLLGEARKQRELPRYLLPTVEIDLLRLITSPLSHDRRMAGQLLSLEPGDPIYLSGDWWPTLQGITFADGITETIDPDGWHISLSLTPYSHVVGDPSPIPRGRTWASISTTWDTEPHTWETV